MNNCGEEFLKMLGLSLVAVGVVLILAGIFSWGYKEGQIDALNNFYYYKLEKNKDGSTDWQRAERYSLSEKVTKETK